MEKAKGTSRGFRVEPDLVAELARLAEPDERSVNKMLNLVLRRALGVGKALPTAGVDAAAQPPPLQLRQKGSSRRE